MFKKILCKSLKINKISIGEEWRKNFTLKKNSEMAGYSSPATGTQLHQGNRANTLAHQPVNLSLARRSFFSEGGNLSTNHLPLPRYQATILKCEKVHHILHGITSQARKTPLKKKAPIAIRVIVTIKALNHTRKTMMAEARLARVGERIGAPGPESPIQAG